MSFNAAAITTLIANIQSGAQQLGLFEQVLTHEPKSGPLHDMTMAFWLTDIKASKVFSGLNETAGVVTFNQRIYVNFLSKPEDQIDIKLLNGVSALLTEYASELTFGSTVMAVDLLGMDSPGFSAPFGYVEIDKMWYRMATLTVPIVIDNLWPQTN